MLPLKNTAIKVPLVSRGRRRHLWTFTRRCLFGFGVFVLGQRLQQRCSSLLATSEPLQPKRPKLRSGRLEGKDPAVLRTHTRPLPRSSAAIRTEQVRVPRWALAGFCVAPRGSWGSWGGGTQKCTGRDRIDPRRVVRGGLACVALQLTWTAGFGGCAPAHWPAVLPAVLR